MDKQTLQNPRSGLAPAADAERLATVPDEFEAPKPRPPPGEAKTRTRLLEADQARLNPLTIALTMASVVTFGRSGSRGPLKRPSAVSSTMPCKADQSHKARA